LRRKDVYGRKSKKGEKVIYVQRKFGFRCKVRLVEERCQLGVTCDGSGFKIGQSLTRQTAHGSGQSGPLNQQTGFQNQQTGFQNQQTGFMRRQTGEVFSSDSSPDCRVELAPGGCQ
jgi:hypothetical protein